MSITIMLSFDRYVLRIAIYERDPNRNRDAAAGLAPRLGRRPGQRRRPAAARRAGRLHRLRHLVAHGEQLRRRPRGGRRGRDRRLRRLREPAGRRYDRVVAISRSGTTTEVARPCATSRAEVATVAIAAVHRRAVRSRPATDHRARLRRRAVGRADPLRHHGVALLLAAYGSRLQPEAEAAAMARPRAPFRGRSARVRRFVFLGHGWTVGLAHEAALKLREAAWRVDRELPRDGVPPRPHRACAEPGTRSGGSAPTTPTWSRRGRAAGPPRSPTPATRSSRSCGQPRSRSPTARGLDPDTPRNLSRSVVLPSSPSVPDEPPAARLTAGSPSPRSSSRPAAPPAAVVLRPDRDHRLARLHRHREQGDHQDRWWWQFNATHPDIARSTSSSTAATTAPETRRRRPSPAASSPTSPTSTARGRPNMATEADRRPDRRGQAAAFGLERLLPGRARGGHRQRQDRRPARPRRQPRARLQQEALRRGRRRLPDSDVDVGRLPRRRQEADRRLEQAVRLGLHQRRQRGHRLALPRAALAGRRADLLDSTARPPATTPRPASRR